MRLYIILYTIYRRKLYIHLFLHKELPDKEEGQKEVGLDRQRGIEIDVATLFNY